ncbi:sensor histidine kinase [Microbacterium trichothecenolyticum]|uniref:Sensor-like histidine kinase SenX3 n=1 Tax=Microbacterium trichothecenolyticum TaxID=69370 RepID=A0A0M2H9L7_MICTR|nr:ATP-binding protein [Microbacterium trichothecenolyticum]KJL43133.1 Signal-transduction histidine kinase senX3 [Microbacterium trichothecenolyticum]
MDTTQLALLALLAGIIIGGSISAVIVASMRARDRAHAEGSIEIPDGVRGVLHGMDDAAVVVDASFTVLAASSAAAAFELLEGGTLPTDELRTLARRVRTTDAEVTEASATETMRLRRGAPPAEPRLVAVRASRISPRLTLLVLRDISERERVEEMRRDFVANTSHELKTPVGAVSLLAEAIESAADDPPQVRIFAMRLQAEANRLALLTSRIMNLSRLQAADELPQQDVSIDEVVASALDAHAIQADSAGVEVMRGGARGLYVHGDAQVLSEAVGNLIANAIAYSPRGSSVGVGIKAVDRIVEIAVTDRGIGIAEGEQDRVFERFYRSDPARARRTGGSGLGLSIVKHAVQRHGGEVRLWSRPGRGSTFTIRLPQIDAPALEPAPKRGRKKKRPAVADMPATEAAPAEVPAPSASAPARGAKSAPAAPGAKPAASARAAKAAAPDRAARSAAPKTPVGPAGGQNPASVANGDPA